jgi:hypothetical protein
MPIKNIPSTEDLQSYFNLDLTNKDSKERKTIEDKLKKFSDNLKGNRIIPDVDITEEEEKIKEVLSFKKLGIKNLDAFNKWLALMDQTNQITSTFVYLPATDEKGIPFLGKLVSTRVLVPPRDRNGYLIQNYDPVSGQLTNQVDFRNIISVAIPPLQARNNLYSLSWMLHNDVPYTSLDGAGDTKYNPTKDYIIKSQIRDWFSKNTSTEVIELIDIPIENYVKEIKDENGKITQAFKPPVTIRFRVSYRRKPIDNLLVSRIQLAKEEYPRLLTTMQDSINSWQQSSSEAMTLDGLLQKAAQTLSPEQLTQFLEEKTKELQNKIKNNTID